MSDDLDLERGDFVYQSDQELFLVVSSELEDGYRFSVHGWREISNERLTEYLDHENGRLHHGDDITELVLSEGEDSVIESFEKLAESFEVYQDIDMSENGPEADFAMDDT